MPSLLVIDDEPNVLYSLERSLRSDTLEVLTANSAKQGIELVQQRRPDAVILDIRLADMSGLDAFDQIRQASVGNPAVSIRLLTTLARLGPRVSGAADRETLQQVADAVRQTALQGDVLELDEIDVKAAWKRASLTLL